MHGALLRALTCGVVETYQRCSEEFMYTTSTAPKRILTKPSKGVHNSGHDNADHDYICRVGDKVLNPDGQSYEISEPLGHGTFGQVLRCQQSPPPSQAQGTPHTSVALKIIKNKAAYFRQALLEVRILKDLNLQVDCDNEKHIVRMLDFFVYRKHLCIAFELLIMNLYQVLKQNGFRGVSLTLNKLLTEQLLKALQCLQDAHIIHCDVKPENILLSSLKSPRIKLCDLGSACSEHHGFSSSYVQSRFYRAPEVMLGCRYTSAIDMWSLGCICAELFLGLPIYPGQSECDQVRQIVEVVGIPPAWMLDKAPHARKFFRLVEVEDPSGSSPAPGGASSSSGGTVDASAPAGVAAARAASEPPAGTRESCTSRSTTAADTSDGQGRERQESDFAASTAAESSESVQEAASGSTAEVGHQHPQEGDSRSPGVTVGRGEEAEELAAEAAAAQSRRRSQWRAGQTFWRVKTRKEFERDGHKTWSERTPGKHFHFKSLEQMMELVPPKPGLSEQVFAEEEQRRLGFLQFLLGVLDMVPGTRWSPKQAVEHSFISGAPLDATFQPSPPAVASSTEAEVRPEAAEAGEAPSALNDVAMFRSMHRLWDRLHAEVPLPDQQLCETFRPQIDQLPWEPRGSIASARVPPSTSSITASTGSIGEEAASPAASGSAFVVREATDKRRPASATTASSPHGSSASSATAQQAPRRRQQRPRGRQSPGGSGDGSQASSPWHLSSPASALNSPSQLSSHGTGSQYSGSDWHLSEQSGSDSAYSTNAGACGSGCTSEDPSCSDASGTRWPRPLGQLSDSDGVTTPQSSEKRWGNVKSEIRRAAGVLNQVGPAGGARNSAANFREAVGMNETGPVVPFGHGIRRDGRIPATHGLQFSPPERGAAGSSESPHSGSSGSGHQDSRRHRGKRQAGMS